MYMNARQLGRGRITVFHESPVPHVQHGGGLSSLFKSVALVVTPLAAKAVRYAGRTGLETGIGILSDVLSGENVKAATKRRASAAFQQAKQDSLTEVKRRRGPSTTTTTFSAKKRRKGGQKGGGRPKTNRVMTMVRRRRIFLDKTTSPRTCISFLHTLRSCEDHCRKKNTAMELEQAPKHYASSHGGNSALELFQIPPTDTSILSARWQPYYPESRIQRGSPIEFNIETTPEYIDLSKCYIKFKLKITKANGANITDKKVIPINNFFHSMIKQMSIKLNNTLVTQQNDTYAYKAYMESLLSYPKDSAESYLTCALWYKDAAGKFGIVETTGMSQGADVPSLVARQAF